MSFFEWLGRVIMLVLAGMITLSIIGAIAAIPYGSNLPRQIGLERQPAPEPQPRAEATPAPTMERDGPGAPAATEPAGSVTLAPAPPEQVGPAEWLEVIAYALLALAGLAALDVLLLWRLVHQQRRIADAISLAPPASFALPSAASRHGS